MAGSSDLGPRRITLDGVESVPTTRVTAPRASSGPAVPPVPGYTILSPLGEGGMGVVYLARRDSTGERLSLKILRTTVVGDDEGRQRLAREVATLSRIRSPWVGEIVDSDPWGKVAYVATRYVPGQPLHDHVVDKGPLRGDDLYQLAGGLAEGIAACHAVGILHRDVKPSNVVMEGRNPVLIDFGLARSDADPRLTQVGLLLGTPGYLPPEILSGEDATPATDVHSWAATVLFAATGRPPFGGGDASVVLTRTRAGEADLDGVAQPLRAVLAGALDPDPLKRPTLNAIRNWLRDPTGPLPVAAPQTALMSVGPVVHPATVPVPDGPPPTTYTAGIGFRMLIVGLALIALTGAAAGAFPVLTGVVLVLSTMVLRGAWRGAYIRAQARAVRGHKWWDGPRMVIGAPVDIVATFPGTFGLLAWAGGVVIAEALICYSLAVPIRWALTAGGLVGALTLAIGPGAAGVRTPLRAMTRSATARWQPWFALLVVLFAAAIGLLLVADYRGPSYVPWPAAWHLPFLHR